MATEYRDIAGREGTLAEINSTKLARQRFYATDGRDAGVDDSGSYGYYDNSITRIFQYTLDDDLNPQTAIGEDGVFFRHSSGAGSGDIDVVLIDNDAGNRSNWPKMWWDESEDNFVFSLADAVQIIKGSSGGTPESDSGFILENNSDVSVQLLSTNTDTISVNFGDNNSATSGQIQYDHNTDHMYIYTGGSNHIRIEDDGKIGFGLGATAVATNAQLEIRLDAVTNNLRMSYDSLRYCDHKMDSSGNYYIDIYTSSIRGNLYINEGESTGFVSIGGTGTLYTSLDVYGDIALDDGIIFGVNVNAEDWGYINKYGYLASTDHYRNLGIGTGKNVVFGVFSGEYASLTLGATDTTYSDLGKLVLYQGALTNAEGITIDAAASDEIRLYIDANDVSRLIRGTTIEHGMAIDNAGNIGINLPLGTSVLSRFSVTQVSTSNTDGISLTKSGSTDVRMYVDSGDVLRIQRSTTSTTGIAILSSGDVDIANYTKLGGAERLKEFSYTATLNSADISASQVVFTITSVDVTKIRRIVAVGYDDNLATVYQSTDAADGHQLLPSVPYTSTANVDLGSTWVAGDTVSIMITEAQ